MKPYQMLAAIASTIAGQLTVQNPYKRYPLAESDWALDPLLFQHPEVEHPELLLTGLPKEAAFSSLTEDLLLLR